ncbi:hypothetical protein, partial [Thalassobaculum salexigens]|uniref:hypothetical protein n=1 Tax=Thalassobaculum salexigens TaxID=455360 RepID=UPI00248DD6AB
NKNIHEKNKTEFKKLYLAIEPRPYKKLNARHRHELLVDALLKDVYVDENKIVDKNGLCASFKVKKQKNGVWQDQLELVLAKKPYRNDRLSEIVIQQTDISSFLTVTRSTPQ